jgi:hypothetical protein
VYASTVAKKFDVVEDTSPGILSGLITLEENMYRIECVKEVLGDRIVVAVVGAAKKKVTRPRVSPT